MDAAGSEASMAVLEGLRMREAGAPMSAPQKRTSLPNGWLSWHFPSADLHWYAKHGRGRKVHSPHTHLGSNAPSPLFAFASWTRVEHLHRLFLSDIQH